MDRTPLMSANDPKRTSLGANFGATPRLIILDQLLDHVVGAQQE